MEMLMPHPDPEVCAELTEMKHAIEALGRKLDALTGAMSKHLAEEERNGPLLEEIILAWQQGVGVLKFVKALAAISVFLGGFFVFLHDKVTWK
jgi:hypothetical protein